MPAVLAGRYQIHISLTTHPSLGNPTSSSTTTTKTSSSAFESARTASTSVSAYLSHCSDLLEETATSDLLRRSSLRVAQTSLQQGLSAKPAPNLDTAFPASRFPDPRLGSLRFDFLQTISMESSSEKAADRPIDSNDHPKSYSGHASNYPSSTSSVWKARFIQSSSFPVEGEGGQTTEVLFGIVHLFRQEQQSKTLTGAQRTSEAGPPEVALDDDSGTLLAFLGLPIEMTAAEFLGWVEPAKESIEKIRMIREANASRCTVLMQFRDASDAEEFYKQYCDQSVPYFASSGNPVAVSTSATPVSSPTTSQIVYVTQVSVSTSSQLPYAYPQLANSDPWPLAVSSTPPRDQEVGSSSLSSSSAAPAARLALSLAQELPTCPVCLERMDSSVTGLMTVSCQHTFHCDCLSRWGDARCPVCRYSQNRSISRGASLFGRSRHRTGVTAAGEDVNGDEEATRCTVCATTDDLWVCLICATVGCGRYKKGCAKKHFAESGHIYSLELETSRVWDYVNDGYIHRLIQNRADGKLVELPTSSQSSPVRRRQAGRRNVSVEAGGSGRTTLQPGQRERRDDLGLSDDDENHDESGSSAELDDPKKSGGKLGSTDEKLEAVSLEYQYLLLSQLEAQRAYYEEQVRRLQTDLDAIKSAMANEETSAPLVAAHEARFEEERRLWLVERSKLEEAQVRLTSRCEKALEGGAKVAGELRSERSLGRGLMERLDAQQREMDRSKREGEELKRTVQDQGEQLRDLMFALSAGEQIRQVASEAEGGDLIVRAGKSRTSTSTSTSTAAATARRSAKDQVHKASTKASVPLAKVESGNVQYTSAAAVATDVEGDTSLCSTSKKKGKSKKKKEKKVNKSQVRCKEVQGEEEEEEEENEAEEQGEEGHLTIKQQEVCPEAEAEAVTLA